MREEILRMIEKNSRIDLKELAIMLGMSEVDLMNEIARMEENDEIEEETVLPGFDENDEIEKRISAFQTKAVDTTGAGDAFVAGFIKGLLQGFSIEKCAQYGNVIGSLAVEKLGASGHEYKKEEIERRLQYVAGFTLSKD